MGRDFPDWGGQYNNKELYPLFDIGELAARLGSIVTFDRRGAVLFANSFDDGLEGYGQSGVLGTSAVSLQTFYRLTGYFAVQLLAAGVTNAYALLSRAFPVPLDFRVGLSLGMAFDTESGRDTISVAYYSGSYLYQASLIVDTPAKTLSIYTPSGEVVIDASLPAFSDYNVFHPIKLVIDLNTGYYIRASFLRNEYDLSGYQIYQQVSAGTPRIYLWVQNKVTGGSLIRTTYIDHFIYTIAEPE